MQGRDLPCLEIFLVFRLMHLVIWNAFKRTRKLPPVNRAEIGTDRCMEGKGSFPAELSPDVLLELV